MGKGLLGSRSRGPKRLEKPRLDQRAEHEVGWSLEVAMDLRQGWTVQRQSGRTSFPLR